MKMAHFRTLTAAGGAAAGTTGSGAPSGTSIDGTRYWDSAGNQLYVYSLGSWHLVGGGVGGVDTANSPAAGELARFTDADTIEGLTEAEFKAAFNLEAGTDFDAAGAAAAAVAAHAAAGDPHPTYLTAAEGDAAYQPLDTQLTSLAGLSYAGNALEVVRVNAGETGFELAAVSGADGLGPDGDKGDVTVGGSGTTLTIDPNVVTYAKMQDVSAGDRLLGRISGAGDPEEITCTAAGRALLDDADAAAQRTTLGAAASSHTHSLSEITDDGALAALSTVGTAQIDNDAVTYAKIQNVTDARLLGRSAGSAGDAQEITVGSGLSLAGGSLTATGGSSPTGVFLDSQFSVLQADGNLAEASGVQTWAGSDRTSQDVFTVAANTTYRFRGQFIINTGTTTHTTAMAFALGGGASVASVEYLVMLWSAAANTIATAQSTTHVSGVASKVLNATSTAVYTTIRFEGIMVVTNGGTVTPQINFSANPTGTCLMKRGSFVEFQRLGADTVTLAGGWA